MSIEETDDLGSRRFLLRCADEKRKNVAFICMAPSDKVHKEWVETINSQLWSLTNFLVGLENPMGCANLGTPRNSM
jgi:hypothetical protein